MLSQHSSSFNVCNLLGVLSSVTKSVQNQKLRIYSVEISFEPSDSEVQRSPYRSVIFGFKSFSKERNHATQILW